MKIKGFVESSLIDFPARICSVIFTPGCNFRCPFCHNPELVVDDKTKGIDEQEVLDYLAKHKKWIDGVCVSGGEPLLQLDIEDFLIKVRALGMQIKIDTNGSNPDLLNELIQKKLVDFIAMDIKSSLETYEKTTNSCVNVENIKKSIELIMNSHLEYEFRTTIVPKFIDGEEIKKIAELIKGANKYVLQQFRNDVTLDEDFKKERSYTPSQLEELRKIASINVKKCEIRGA